MNGAIGCSRVWTGWRQARARPWRDGGSGDRTRLAAQRARRGRVVDAQAGQQVRRAQAALGVALHQLTQRLLDLAQHTSGTRKLAVPGRPARWRLRSTFKTSDGIGRAVGSAGAQRGQRAPPRNALNAFLPGSRLVVAAHAALQDRPEAGHVEQSQVEVGGQQARIVGGAQRAEGGAE